MRTLAGFVLITILGLSTAHAQDEGSARPPQWVAQGAYVYRVSTPDEPDLLPQLAEGHALVANLLDGSVPQLTIVNGLIGHDHRGPWNWDGLWPYWNRVTFRAGNCKKLSTFMAKAKNDSNTHTGFHLNVTDVNVGLRDYPESIAFFKKLAETRSIYRRDFNKTTNSRAGQPYVPASIDKHIDKPQQPDPVQIFALVNYKRFWDSGLAKVMIDDFYGKLPFAPPLLYLDVLNPSGGNFATGVPDGPFAGSKESQIEGMRAIADYLHTKGTALGTEGEREFLGNNPAGKPRASYVWLHGKGFSEDDYSIIRGGAAIRLACLHVYGNPGAFNVSPIASTRTGLDKVRAHHAALLAGKPGTRAVADLKTCRIAIREGTKDEFDIPGTGDPFRGDWIDLVNNFYLITIQELYHIGNRSVRQRSDSIGAVHLGSYTVAGPGGTVTAAGPDFVEPEWSRKAAQKYGRDMIERPITTHIKVPRAGNFALRVDCFLGGRTSDARLGVYVNGRHHRSFEKVPISEGKHYELDAGMVELREGDNTIGFDSGPIRAVWSDGTRAEWTTPALATGFRAWKGDVVFADGYDRMWPDTWSGHRKIYFFSWDGTNRTWKLPEDWAGRTMARLYPLTPAGRGPVRIVPLTNGSITQRLLPQVPYVLVSHSDLRP